jgi:hypothetical protein
MAQDTILTGPQGHDDRLVIIGRLQLPGLPAPSGGSLIMPEQLD